MDGAGIAPSTLAPLAQSLGLRVGGDPMRERLYLCPVWTRRFKGPFRSKWGWALTDAYSPAVYQVHSFGRLRCVLWSLRHGYGWPR